MSKSSKKKLEFHGGLAAAFIPVVIFLFFCILYFVIFQAFEMYALAMGAFIGLLVGALFARNGGYDTFWEAVYDGAREAIPVGVLLLIIGMFSAMIKATNISTGFVWLAEKTGVSG
ncbi:MAG: Na+/H+ antiporter NhaC family protein, partial [Lachnospiraceae bacterium]